MTKPLNEMTVAELRRYAIDGGWGVKYLSERRKVDLIKILETFKRDQEEREKHEALRLEAKAKLEAEKEKA